MTVHHCDVAPGVEVLIGEDVVVRIVGHDTDRLRLFVSAPSDAHVRKVDPQPARAPSTLRAASELFL